MSLKRRRLLAAVRDRMRHQAEARETEDAGRADVAPERPEPAVAPRRRAEPDHELDRLAAEARYHRERFDLYRARVISGSSVATSPSRLRELERTAAAAEERLAHARQGRRTP
jgi:hypothetical protein